MPRNPHQVDLCVFASSSCRDYTETKERKRRHWPALLACLTLRSSSLQAGGASLAYVVYRQLVAFYFGFHVVLLVAASCYTGSLKWLVFFSMWSLIVLTVNVVAQAVAVTMHYRSPEGTVEGQRHNDTFSRYHYYHSSTASP